MTKWMSEWVSSVNTLFAWLKSLINDTFNNGVSIYVSIINTKCNMVEECIQLKPYPKWHKAFLLFCHYSLRFQWCCWSISLQGWRAVLVTFRLVCHPLVVSYCKSLHFIQTEESMYFTSFPPLVKFELQRTAHVNTSEL